jgi:hypothetical protein
MIICFFSNQARFSESMMLMSASNDHVLLDEQFGLGLNA